MTHPALLLCLSSVYLSFWRMSTHAGWSTQFSGPVSWALYGMVWRGPAGGLHHWIWLGQRKTRTSEKYYNILYIPSKTLNRCLKSPSALRLKLCFASRKPWPHTSPMLRRYTSTFCPCTATVGSRARAPSCSGVISSTCAASRVCVGPCWSARSSWCPSTGKQALRKRVLLPSPLGL